METSKYFALFSVVQIYILVILLMNILELLIYQVRADVIMMNTNGVPSIIENDDIEPDVILMPGMNNMVINDDLVL